MTISSPSHPLVCTTGRLLQMSHEQVDADALAGALLGAPDHVRSDPAIMPVLAKLAQSQPYGWHHVILACPIPGPQPDSQRIINATADTMTALDFSDTGASGFFCGGALDAIQDWVGRGHPGIGNADAVQRILAPPPHDPHGSCEHAGVCHLRQIITDTIITKRLVQPSTWLRIGQPAIDWAIENMGHGGAELLTIIADASHPLGDTGR